MSNSVFFYEPFYHFDRFFDAMRPLVRNVEASPQFERNTSAVSSPFRPRMDLHEDSEKNLVSATLELPGVKKEDVQLEVRDGLLTVSAEAKSSVEHEDNGYSIRERRFGMFSRSVRLPRGVKDEDIKASMTDGILTVTFPKHSSEEEPKRISIA